MTYSEQDKITSFHEAGHAICGTSLGYTIARVSIEPTIDNIGFCGGDRHLSDLASAIWYLSGAAADAKFRQSIGLPADYRGSRQDFDDTHRVLSALVPHLPRAALFDTPIFKTTWDDAEGLVNGLWSEIKQFADVLLAHKTLVGSELKDALAGRPVKSITSRRSSLDKKLDRLRESVAKLSAKYGKRQQPVSPMRAGASSFLNMPIGHAFRDDVLAKHGVKIMSNAEKQAILDEHHRIMGSGIARRTGAKPTVSPKLAAVRAIAKREMIELNKRHAAR